MVQICQESRNNLLGTGQPELVGVQTGYAEGKRCRESRGRWVSGPLQVRPGMLSAHVRTVLENSSVGHGWDEANGWVHRGSRTAAVDTSGTRTSRGLPLQEPSTSLYLAGDGAALTHSTGQSLSILLTRQPARWVPACPHRAAAWAAVKVVLPGAPSHTYLQDLKETHRKTTRYRTWAVKKKACSSGYQEKSLFLLQVFLSPVTSMTKQCAKCQRKNIYRAQTHSNRLVNEGSWQAMN